MPSLPSAADDPPPPLPGLTLVPMEVGHLDAVLEIERSSFASPWQRRHFVHEIEQNPVAVNRVALDARRLVAYASLWQIERELKINNVAVHPELRRRGVGNWLLGRVLREAARRRCRTASLEVRASNRSAIALYARHGFVEVGRRRGYYQLEDEDAILMTAKLPTPG